MKNITEVKFYDNFVGTDCLPTRKEEMIYICPRHKEEMVFVRIVSQNDVTLGWLWVCPKRECDETVEPTQKEIAERE